MIDINLDLLYGWINAFFLPFSRIAALIGAAPFFGESSTPLRLKVALSVMLTAVIAPTLGSMPDLTPGSYTSILLIFQQILIGIALALVLRIVFAAVITAGEFVGLQMGLAFASFFDPATGANTAVLSRLLNVVAMLIFIALNGHLLLIQALVNTFHILPITANFSLQPEGWAVLFEWSSEIMHGGLQLALPMMIILLTISLSMGILNRTAQQLSIFAVGFPISLMTGLVLLATIVPRSSPYLESMFSNSYETMAKLIYALGGG